MKQFLAEIKRFGNKGEKTGWTYIEIPASMVHELQPGIKTSFRIKGKIDSYELKQTALLPMGDGNFILPLNGKIRKAIKKDKGATVLVEMTLDNSEIELSKNLLECLHDEPAALVFYNTLPPSHQRYFSNWIESAKTYSTKSNRIAKAVNALAAKKGFGEMLRDEKERRI